MRESMIWKAATEEVDSKPQAFTSARASWFSSLASAIFDVITPTFAAEAFTVDPARFPEAGCWQARVNTDGYGEVGTDFLSTGLKPSAENRPDLPLQTWESGLEHQEPFEC